MKTIFILILALLGGFLFGIILSRFFISFSNFILGRKTRKDILRKGLSQEELKRRNFFFRNQAYNIAEQVEYDLNKRVSLFKKIKNLFQKKKGVSEYGSQPTGNAGNSGLRDEQVSTIRDGTSSPSPTATTDNATGEQPSTNTTETRGE